MNLFHSSHTLTWETLSANRVLRKVPLFLLRRYPRIQLPLRMLCCVVPLPVLSPKNKLLPRTITGCLTLKHISHLNALEQSLYIMTPITR
jgi:hypothetical protein